ncbi:cytochrome c maturation protein CcmE [Pelagibacteraceae bacterium]|nr:cytochrome c maturation protein CcmE [Pelagibacteraceae bacterium]
MSLRFQRLLLILISLIMIFGAVLLILYNARENISYFYTPSELIYSKMNNNKKIRIGGFVEENSFIKVTASSFKFKITDNYNSIRVNYNGILPDLFKEGQGAVIEGIIDKNNILNATNVFAKHDENYIPASIKEELENKGYWNKNYK